MECAVSVAREDFPTITAKEFNGLYVFAVVGLHESFESSREREMVAGWERESCGEEILVSERFKPMGNPIFKIHFFYFSKFSWQPNDGPLSFLSYSSIFLLLSCYCVYGHFGNFDNWVIGWVVVYPL